MSDPPPELPHGQDDEPPDLLQTLRVARILLADLYELLDARDDREEILGRIRAVHAVLARLARRLEDQQ